MKKFIAFFASLLSAGAATAATTPDQALLPKMEKAADLVAWEDTKRHVSNRALVQFMLEYPDSQFVEEARGMLLEGTPAENAVAIAPADGDASDLYSDFYQHI